MNRRSFLSTLAALPGLGWLKPSRASSTIEIGSIAVINTNAEDVVLFSGESPTRITYRYGYRYIDPGPGR
jgi:hypothetical protein